MIFGLHDFFFIIFCETVSVVEPQCKRKKNKKKFTKRIKEKVKKGKEETSTLSIQCSEKEEGPFQKMKTVMSGLRMGKYN